MANKDPSRTEQATSKKIEETRKEGQVLTSPELSSFIILLGGSIMLFLSIPMISGSFMNFFTQITLTDCRETWKEEEVINITIKFFWEITKSSGPFCFAIFMLALIVMRAQVGKYFSMTALKWKFSGLNPKSGVMSLLPNKQNAIKLGLTGAKVMVVACFVYYSIKGDFEDFLKLPLMPLMPAAVWMGQRCFIMVLKILTVFVAIVIIDYVVKRKKYYDDLMMTKQEVKDERKNQEGDPRIKAKIRSKMRQLIRASMMKSIKKADVVITNPTHVAVALKYEFGTYAPTVVAKGLRKTAERIKEIARMNDIPIVEAPPLARSLYRNTPLGGFIPAEFFG
ncbi:MAG: EscU/YscU/HrcU family type III secretion system export apparatus switch protein, partial [Candidatus Saccharimonadaceae bacterium]|nr:EscU/YscU/HrcU family type III secretion system export apparatus switch protein [Candidatus Saccharimonadaceae bacterium]